MNIIIKSATIIDSKSEFHNSTRDILIEKGRITKISKSIRNTSNYKELRFDNLHISQGWFDSSVCFGEPGFEDRETIANGLNVAAKSGFTAVAMNANTHPVLQSNSDITFVKTKAQEHAVNLVPIGALTKDSKGENLSELFDMNTAGAKAFYDYKKPIVNANLMKIALQYASGFDGLVCAFPQDNSVAGDGVMNEHITSTTLGLKGIPALSESLQIARDIQLLEYTGGKLHIPTISTAASVDLIRKAKKQKLDISCSVAIHNLFFNDNVLSNFDTNYKVLPPLRTQNDSDALINGLKDGTIDMVTSDHNPLTIESKNVEFDYADFGSVGLESAFPALNTLFTIKKTIELLTNGKARFSIRDTPIQVGEVASLSLFNPSSKRTFNVDSILSKSTNSIFIDQNLNGETYGIISNNKIILK